MIKIFLLFYMCHFAMSLTHCYKTTVFFTFILLKYRYLQRSRFMGFSDKTIINYGTNGPVGLSSEFQLFIESAGHCKIYVSDED